MSIFKKVASAAVGIATIAAGHVGDGKMKDYVRAHNYVSKRNQPTIVRKK